MDEEDLKTLGFYDFQDALAAGIAAHHAGMLPVFKETVEELFARGLVKVVFATETLSLGINMPARTVVIEDLFKFTGERHELLTPLDYTQLTGRAGRRGIDELGYAIVLYTPFVPPDRIAALATRKDYELTSSFRPSYNMAVNLVTNFSEDEALRLLNSSFAQYTTDRDVVRWERRLVGKERELEEARGRAVCEHGDVVEYAAMREQAAEGMRTERGSPEVQKAFARLAPGDVIAAQHLGRALVCEQPRTKGSGEPRVTVMTADRKLRRVGPRDFRQPPEPVAKLRLRGQAWRSPKNRRGLARELQNLNVPRAQPQAAPSEVRRLVRAYEQHPVHGCPDVDEHLAWAQRALTADREAAALRKRVRRRKDTLARTLERVLNVLRGAGYVTGWELTHKGELLRRVYNESDLLVVETLSRGWFAGLDPDELAALASVFVYEARGRDEPESAPSPHLARYVRRILGLHKQLAASEAEQGLELLREPDGGFMGVISEWAGGASLEDVLEDRQLTAGDFVRWAKQVVDLLQQLRAVVDEGGLADTLADSVRAVQRGVVAYTGI
jgi:ATP-dependent RNA helicase HelY